MPAGLVKSAPRTRRPSVGNQAVTSIKASKRKSSAAAETPSKAVTFKHPKLEADFLRYCQLTTETDSNPLSTSELDALLERADFIVSSEFSTHDAEKKILGDDLLSACEPVEPKRSTKKVNLPPHLAGLCEARLLEVGQERNLFQRMNYLRFRAAAILQSHSATTLGQWDIERTRGLLKAADWHRDLLVKANVRLVISIVKKFANQQCGFDDLLSDGIMALIRSVDKFDYQLGFRFSTYATQVVRRNSYRFVMDRQDERLRVVNSISDGGLDVAEDEGISSLDEVRWNELRSRLQDFMGRLEKREKFIVRARFSLGGHRRVQTLQRLADVLGISKERVRQIEKRAMDKLAAMARERPFVPVCND
jgi:RNA polymerase primary sigma factor